MLLAKARPHGQRRDAGLAIDPRSDLRAGAADTSRREARGRSGAAAGPVGFRSTTASFQSPPCRSAGHRTGNRPACRAIQERWFQHHSDAHARQDRARLGAGIPCTRRPAAHGLRLRCRASSADPAALSCAAQRPARRLCLAVARGGAYCFGGGGNASRQAKTGSCTPNCCWMTGAVRPTFQPMQDDGGARA